MKRILPILLVIISFCLPSLFMTACSETGQDRANDMEQMEENIDLTNKIETAKEDVASYFETHKQVLNDFAQGLLEIMHEKENVESINVHHDRAEAELFSTDGAYSVLPIADLPNLDGLLSAMEVDASPFKIIHALSAGTYFDSPTCQFGMSIYNNEELYYYIELTYTEEENANVKTPDIAEQLAPHWYIVGHYWY